MLEFARKASRTLVKRIAITSKRRRRGIDPPSLLKTPTSQQEERGDRLQEFAGEAFKPRGRGRVRHQRRRRREEASQNFPLECVDVTGKRKVAMGSETRRGI